MAYNYILFWVSFSILILSNISICIAPIINKIIKDSQKWGTRNCKLYSDLNNNYEKDKSLNNKFQNDEQKQKYLSKLKDAHYLCNTKKRMNDFEYASLIADIIIGFIFSLLALIEIMDSQNLEKNDILSKTIGNYGIKGIIFMMIGLILGLILTLVYIIESLIIFINGSPGKEYENPNDPNTFSAYNSNKIFKLDEERSFALWNKDKKLYECYYYDENDEDLFYIKYYELSKKQYNYDMKLYISSLINNSKINNCNCNNESCNPFEECKLHRIHDKWSRPIYGDDMFCPNLVYNDDTIHLGSYNKYIYNRWLTTIVFGFIIIILYGILIGIFGYLSYGKIMAKFQ